MDFPLLILTNLWTCLLWVCTHLVLFSVYLCFRVSRTPLFLLWCIIQDLRTHSSHKHAFIILRGLFSESICLKWLKQVTETGRPHWLALRPPYLVLSLFHILIRGPPLPVVTVRHFVWANKLDAAKIFSPLGDDARHFGRHKQVHLKEARKLSFPQQEIPALKPDSFRAMSSLLI